MAQNLHIFNPFSALLGFFNSKIYMRQLEFGETNEIEKLQ